MIPAPAEAVRNTNSAAAESRFKQYAQKTTVRYGAVTSGNYPGCNGPGICQHTGMYEIHPM
ncbi:hypothetical protein K340107D12_54630 [Blautia parvula]|uniref:Uncharacterized protein n=1 Tax=Blautia parvula TaxID=2877527 RepID=A0ABQ0C1H7_9FIRM